MLRNPVSDFGVWVFRDDEHRRKFWVAVFLGGRVEWLKGGFKSSNKAHIAGKIQANTLGGTYYIPERYRTN